MNDFAPKHEVLTLEEAAGFLRLTSRETRELAKKTDIPGRLIGRKWRFLKSALEEWLCRNHRKKQILKSAGIFKDDPSFSKLVEEIYKERRRHPIGDGND
ncbi:MAG: helix-turn-helix domain-containing protein [Planctomycetes bacterium]|nr:helix-turn-helix domain-containing protein [Planctomycetota bacterium]